MELHRIWPETFISRRIADRGVSRVQLAGAALLVVVALWGASFVVVRSAVSAYPVVGFLFLRFMLGGGALMAIAYARRSTRPNWATVPKLPMIAVGVALAVGYVTQTLGLALGASVGVAATLTSLVVVLAPAWEWAMTGNAPDRKVAVSSVLAIGGTLLVCQSAAPATTIAHPAQTLGIALEVVSAAAFALQVVLVGRLGPSLSATALGGAQLLLVAALIAPLLPLTGGIPALGGAELAAVVFSALVASAFGFAVQAAAQRHLSTGAAAVIMATEPAFALGAGIAVGEHVIGALAVIGLGLLLSGVLAQSERRWTERVRRLTLILPGSRLRRQEA
ncbi:MAG: DMT family transporter [Candidatus Dormibacteria bacterium]